MKKNNKLCKFETLIEEACEKYENKKKLNESGKIKEKKKKRGLKK